MGEVLIKCAQVKFRCNFISSSYTEAITFAFASIFFIMLISSSEIYRTFFISQSQIISFVFILAIFFGIWAVRFMQGKCAQYIETTTKFWGFIFNGIGITLIETKFTSAC